MNNFHIKLNFVILTTDAESSSQHILSADSSIILLPSIDLQPEWVDSLDSNIINYLKNEYIFVSEYDLLPQIISVSSKHIEKENDNTLNMVYGFVVPYSKNLSDQAHWIRFDYSNPVQYTGLIFEVIQKLR
jgi:hypothetical protein